MKEKWSSSCIQQYNNFISNNSDLQLTSHSRSYETNRNIKQEINRLSIEYNTMLEAVVFHLSLAEFLFGRQTGGQANQCTFKRSFCRAIFTKTTFRRTLVCLPAKWEFRQTQLTSVVIFRVATWPFLVANPGRHNPTENPGSATEYIFPVTDPEICQRGSMHDL